MLCGRLFLNLYVCRCVQHKGWCYNLILVCCWAWIFFAPSSSLGGTNLYITKSWNVAFNAATLTLHHISCHVILFFSFFKYNLSYNLKMVFTIFSPINAAHYLFIYFYYHPIINPTHYLFIYFHYSLTISSPHYFFNLSSSLTFSSPHYPLH